MQHVTGQGVAQSNHQCDTQKIKEGFGLKSILQLIFTKNNPIKTIKTFINHLSTLKIPQNNCGQPTISSFFGEFFFHLSNSRIEK
jgi:hypothetical protein